MESYIPLQKESDLYCQIKKSKRAKRMRVTVYRDCNVVVTVPFNMNESIYTAFIEQKKEWIIATIDSFKKKGDRIILPSDKRSYMQHKEKARQLISDRVAFYNTFYKFPYTKVQIRNQRTRWGSCSSKNNLNFNYKLIFLPLHLVDYVVVHELCHLKEFNHSKRFWDLVGSTIPEYKKHRKELHTYII